VSLDERSFFSDKNETRPARYACPRCNRTNEYSIRWVRRVKKDRLPPGADERDRAKFAKLRDHLIRVDDELVCKTCSKRFEIPSLHSLLFVDQFEGLPKDEDEDIDADTQTPAAPSPSAAASPTQPAQPGGRAPERRQPRRMTNPSRGWKG
jgi:hypothetical protein